MADQFQKPIPSRFYDDNEAVEWFRSVTFFLDNLTRPGGAIDTGEETAITVETQGATIESLASDLSTVTAQVNSNTADLSGLQNNLPDYTISNDGTVRSHNADAAAGAISPAPSQAEVENLRDAILAQGDVLATVIRDLANKGLLGD